MPAPVAQLDAAVVRRWAEDAVAGLAATAGRIDALNVFPVADSDTGANLLRTLQAGLAGLDGLDPAATVAQVSDTFARSCLLGAAGNSGTIVSQLLRGLADAAAGRDGLDGAALAAALSQAAGAAREAVARPVEGTILTVADAAARAAQAVLAQAGPVPDVASPGVAEVARAACEAAEAALAETPDRLARLGGRVDAGGLGLVVLLHALVRATTVQPAGNEAALEPEPDGSWAAEVASRWPVDGPVPPGGPAMVDGVRSAGPTAEPGGPAYEVMYLLHTDANAVASGDLAGLREALDRLGDSVVVVGGSGLWQVHAHVDDIGAAVEAGLAVGTPSRIRVTRLSGEPDAVGQGGPVVVAVVAGPKLADLLRSAGAIVVDEALGDEAGIAASIGATVAAAHGRPVVLLPGSPAALAAADLVEAGSSAAVRVVRSSSAVQVVAALAVHDAGRDPGRDLVEMAAASAGCRAGLVEVAEGEGLTSAGWCHAGDVLGHVGGDVAIVGDDLERVGASVVDLLLGGGGELVTLIEGEPAPAGLAQRVGAAVRRRRPDVEVTVYAGGQPSSYLLVGVE